MLILKNHTAWDDKTVSVDKIKISEETIKQVFWHTSINDQRPKLKIWRNVVAIEDLLDTDTD